MFDKVQEESAEVAQLAQDYVNSSGKYLKLKTFEQLSLTFSALIRILAIGGLTIVGLSFMAIALALAIGRQMDSLTWGFLIVAFGYLFLAWVIYLFRKSITNSVIRTMSSQFFDNDEA